jgi:hypothetical protein
VSTIIVRTMDPEYPMFVDRSSRVKCVKVVAVAVLARLPLRNCPGVGYVGRTRPGARAGIVPETIRVRWIVSWEEQKIPTIVRRKQEDMCPVTDSTRQIMPPNRLRWPCEMFVRERGEVEREVA